MVFARFGRAGSPHPRCTPYVEEARAQIAKEYGAPLAACDRIRDYADELLKDWRGRPLDPEKGAEMILAAIFARSLNTYCAAIELTRIGFAEHAAMLNRSLFEDMVDAHWVSVKEELAVERYEQHHEHGKMLLAYALIAYPDFFRMVPCGGSRSSRSHRGG